MGKQVTVEPRRFYDGGTLPRDGHPGEAPDPGSDPRIVLERLARRAPRVAWVLGALVVVGALVVFGLVSLG